MSIIIFLYYTGELYASIENGSTPLAKPEKQEEGKAQLGYDTINDDMIGAMKEARARERARKGPNKDRSDGHYNVLHIPVIDKKPLPPARDDYSTIASAFQTSVAENNPDSLPLYSTVNKKKSSTLPVEDLTQHQESNPAFYSTVNKSKKKSSTLPVEDLTQHQESYPGGNYLNVAVGDKKGPGVLKSPSPPPIPLRNESNITESRREEDKSYGEVTNMKSLEIENLNHTEAVPPPIPRKLSVKDNIIDRTCHGDAAQKFGDNAYSGEDIDELETIMASLQ